MFFSPRRKTKDLEQAAKAAHETARRETARKPAAKAGHTAHPAFGDSVQPPEEISDLKYLPTGTAYFPFKEFPGELPGMFERAFALLRKSPTELILLRTVDEFMGRVEHEIVARCTSKGLKVGARLCATREIIKALHDQHYKKVEAGGDRKDSSIERQAWDIVELAVNKGASDIHIETREAQADVFFRIHGERFNQPALSGETALGIMRVLYNVHADAGNAGTSWDPTVVQDTAVEYQMPNGLKIQLRFNTAPIYPDGNVQCTMRVLRMDGDQSAKEMEQVGYTPEMVEQIEEMLVGSTGLVLLVGPTNSGKSTSLQSFVKRIYAHRGSKIKVVTIEDPVEYIMDRACQMGVPRGKNEPEKIAKIYKDLLGSTLRQDPDVALVGEIRTNEQAEPVKDMVLAGRKILSTLHAYEAMAVFPRLREIGIPESLLTRPGFVSGVIYQRLVPVLCPDCSEPLQESHIKEGRIRAATFDRVIACCEIGPGCKHDVRVRNLGGCDKCNFTGIIGRTPCAELLMPDAMFLRYVRKNDELGAKNYWHRTGINTDGAGVRAIAHAIAKMRRGMVDPTDVEVQIGKIEIDRSEAPDPEHGHVPTLGPASYGREEREEEVMGVGGRNSAFQSKHSHQSAFGDLH